MSAKFGKKNERWVEAHPEIARVIANLRGEAGMSEETIFRVMSGGSLKAKRPNQPAAFRGELAPRDKPSIRDLRASFARYKAGYRTIDGKRGFRLDPKTGEPIAVKTGAGSAYLKRRKESVFSEHQKLLLDRKTAVGHMIRFEVPNEEWRDPEALEEFYETGYEATPPF